MTHKVPFFALDKQFMAIRDEVMPTIESILRTGRVLQGDQTKQLELRLAELHEMRHCIAVGSGTDALVIAIKSLNLPIQSRVAVPAMTFVATAEAVVANQLIPVFVDVDPTTMMVDMKALRRLVEARQIDAAIVVPLYGQMIDAEELAEEMYRMGIPLVEDAAQALGATRFGERVGRLADITCLSFDPTKPIGAYGSGGALLTNRDDLAGIAREIRYHGQTESGVYGRSGFNFQIDELQAGIINIKLDYLDIWQERRQQIAAQYMKDLTEVPGIEILSVLPGNTHTYHKFVIEVTGRDSLQQQLLNSGIETKIHYRLPLHKQPAFEEYGVGVTLQNAEEAGRSLLSIPIYPELTDEEVEYIVSSIRSFSK